VLSLAAAHLSLSDAGTRLCLEERFCALYLALWNTVLVWTDVCLCSRDVHGNWNPSGNGNPMGMGQELNKQWEWEWDSIRMGMGMTPIPMGMDSHQRLRKIVEFRFRPKK